MQDLFLVLVMFALRNVDPFLCVSFYSLSVFFFFSQVINQVIARYRYLQKAFEDEIKKVSFHFTVCVLIKWRILQGRTEIQI